MLANPSSGLAIYLRLLLLLNLESEGIHRAATFEVLRGIACSLNVASVLLSASGSAIFVAEQLPPRQASKSGPQHKQQSAHSTVRLTRPPSLKPTSTVLRFTPRNFIFSGITSLRSQLPIRRKGSATHPIMGDNLNSMLLHPPLAILCDPVIHALGIAHPPLFPCRKYQILQFQKEKFRI